MIEGNIQLGKQGITENFIETLKSHFKKYKNMRVSVLQSARGEGKEGKKKVKEYTEKILEELGENYTAKIIGFKIILKKWRRAMR